MRGEDVNQQDQDQYQWQPSDDHGQSTKKKKGEDIAGKVEQLCRNYWKDNSIIVIGGGKMARSLVDGFVMRKGCFNRSQVYICTKTAETALKWNMNGYPKAYSCDKFYLKVDGCKAFLLIAVKPQKFCSFLDEACQNGWLRKCLEFSPLVISIMAGITLREIDAQVNLRSCTPISRSARLMPNIACAIGAGSLLLTVKKDMPEQMVDLLQLLASSVGQCHRLEEDQFNAASALSGCSPAFICLIIEAMADGGVLCGLNRELAVRLATEAVMGTGGLMLDQLKNNSSNISPALLKDQVCSPAGTTISGVEQLEKNGVRNAFIAAIKASVNRAVELSVKSNAMK